MKANNTYLNLTLLSLLYRFIRVMKKAIVFILIALYSISAIGVSVSAHYCGGKLASVSFAFDKESKCSCGAKKMKKGCCTEKHITQQLTETQLKTQELTLPNFSTLQSDLFLASAKIVDPTFSTCAWKYAFNHPISFYIKQPLYVTNQVFLI